MAGVTSRRYTREEAAALSRSLRGDNTGSSDSATGARDAAYQVYVSGLREGPDAVGVPLGDRHGAYDASIEAAEATRKHVADRQPDSRAEAESARERMIADMQQAYKGSA